MALRIHRRATAFLLVALGGSGLLLAGCSERAGEPLLGRWEGRPDSAEAYLARHRPPGEQDGVTAKPEFPIAPPSPDRTDLEEVEVRVVLDFARDGSVTMWRDDEQDELRGTWEVKEADGRKLRLAIATPGNENQGVAAQTRIFQIEFENPGTGFILSEEGADPRLGWLYFQRISP